MLLTTVTAITIATVAFLWSIVRLSQSNPQYITTAVSGFKGFLVVVVLWMLRPVGTVIVDALAALGGML